MKNNLLSDKLAYNGDTKTRTHLHLCSYTVDRVEEAAGDDFEEMKSRFQPDGITWLQIHGLEDTDAVQTVCTHFGIDFLVMQDILNEDKDFLIDAMDREMLIEKVFTRVRNINGNILYIILRLENAKKIPYLYQVPVLRNYVNIDKAIVGEIIQKYRYIFN